VGISPTEAVLVIASHFLLTWWPVAKRILAKTHKVILRDRGLCQVPGCSRPADHVHHLQYRSAGGPLVSWNEIGGCLPHHIYGIHQGNVAVSGRAPDRLTWILGRPAVAAARRMS
jgi:hypothetical protein